MPFPESLKAELRKRAAFRCCRCHEIGVEIHHIVPQADGGADGEDNAAPLCPNCHTWFGGNPDKRKEIREMRDWWYGVVQTKYGARENDMASKLDELLQAVRTQGAKSEPTGEPSAEPWGEEGLSDSRLRAARDSLATSERYVLENDVSKARVNALRGAILEERKASDIRRLFQAVRGYERRKEYRSDTRFGVRFLGWKGPLVEGSSWAGYRPRDFSDAPERFLAFQLGSLLEHERLDGPVMRSWADATAFCSEAIRQIDGRGGHADVLVVGGWLEQSIQSDLLRSADWSTPRTIRSVDVSDTASIRETANGLPVLEIRDARLSPSVHVVDLTDFRYVQTNPDAMSDDDLLLRVDEINWELAVEMLNRAPGLAESLYRSTRGEDGRFNREEAVVHLQLQVKLNIVEGGLIEYARDAFSKSTAVLGRSAEGKGG